jgi:hypothetical protein
LDSDTAPDSAYAVWGDGSYIYVADRTDGFHIYSFDGTTLTLEESSTIGLKMEHVWGDGTYIYFADNEAGVSGRLYTFSYNGAVLSLVETVSLRTSKVWGDGTHLYSLSGSTLNIFSTGACYDAGTSGNDNLGNHTATLPLNMSTNKITGLADPTLAQDAATKAYVDANGGVLSGLSCTDGQVAEWDNGGSVWVCATASGTDNLGDHTATTDLIMAANKITGLADPTAAQDAATKAYVDANGGVLSGLSCASGEVAKWDGSGWNCATDNSGGGGGGALDCDFTVNRYVSSPIHYAGASYENDRIYSPNVNRLRVYDATDLTAPFELGNVSIVSKSYIQSIKQGNIVFSLATDALTAVDVTNEAAPVVSSTFTTGISGARYMYIEGNYAYIAMGGDLVRAFDISDPTSISLAGSVVAPSGLIGVAGYMTKVGDNLFVAGDATASVNWVAFDISTPGTPVYEGYVYSGNFSSTMMSSYAKVGNFFVMGVRVNGATPYLMMYDFTQLPDLSAQPSQRVNVSSVVTHPLFNTNMNYTFHIEGDLLYMIASGSHMHVMDISNPYNPTMVTTDNNSDYRGASYGGWTITKNNKIYAKQPSHMAEISSTCPLNGGGGGGGSDTLAGLTCTDGQVAEWNNAGSAWICATPSGGAGDDLGNHTATTALGMATNKITNAGGIIFSSIAGNSPTK